MVAIKDMEMPKDCMECMFCNHIKSNDYGTYGDCAILGDKERMNLLLHQKHSDCPLIDIEERKVGKWLYDKTSQNWRCSVCNETPKTMGFCGTSDFMKKEFTFCNHCGAKMRGAENG